MCRPWEQDSTRTVESMSGGVELALRFGGERISELPRLFHDVTSGHWNGTLGIALGRGFNQRLAFGRRPPGAAPRLGQIGPSSCSARNGSTRGFLSDWETWLTAFLAG